MKSFQPSKSSNTINTIKRCFKTCHFVAMPPHHLGDNSALAIPLHALVDPMLQLHRWVSWNIQGTPQKVTNTTVTFVNHLKRVDEKGVLYHELCYRFDIIGYSHVLTEPNFLTSTRHTRHTRHGTAVVCRPPPPVLLQRLHDNVMLQSNCRIHTLRALKQMSDHVFTEKQSLKLLKHAFSMLLDASGHYLNMGLIVNYVLFVGKKSLEWKVDFQCLGSVVSVFRPRRGCSIICCQRQWRLTRNSQQPERSKRSNMTANFDYWLDFIWIRTKDMICVYVYVIIYACI